MARHHVIISGTGRAGTTFLIQLLTGLGLDTGFTSDYLPINENCNAGLEQDIFQENAPYIIKNPWLCDSIQEVLARPDIVIDHAFIPIRDLRASAQSRIYVDATSDKAAFPQGVPGGLWHTSDPSQQESILARQFYKLVYHLSKSEVPMTFMHYPRLTQDARYLYNKLATLLTGISYENFARDFDVIARPDLVHRFSENDNF